MRGKDIDIRLGISEGIYEKIKRDNDLIDYYDEIVETDAMDFDFEVESDEEIIDFGLMDAEVETTAVEKEDTEEYYSEEDIGGLAMLVLQSIREEEEAQIDNIDTSDIEEFDEQDIAESYTNGIRELAEPLSEEDIFEDIADEDYMEGTDDGSEGLEFDDEDTGIFEAEDPEENSLDDEYNDIFEIDDEDDVIDIEDIAPEESSDKENVQDDVWEIEYDNDVFEDEDMSEMEEPEQEDGDIFEYDEYDEDDEYEVEIPGNDSVEKEIVEEDALETDIFEDDTSEEDIFEEDTEDDNTLETDIFEDDTSEEDIFEEEIVKGDTLETDIFDEDTIEEDIFEEDEAEESIFEESIFEEYTVEEDSIFEADNVGNRVDNTENSSIEDTEQLSKEKNTKVVNKPEKKESHTKKARYEDTTREEIIKLQKQIEALQRATLDKERKSANNQEQTQVKPKKKKKYTVEMYSMMPIEKLYSHVKGYFNKSGVKNRLVDIQELNNKFGADNIRKLVDKSYIIKIGKGATIGK